MAYSILPPLEKMVKSLFYLIILYLISSQAYKYWIILNDIVETAQRNSWNDVISFIGKPLIIISLSVCLILLFLLDDIFWNRIEFKVMEYDVSKNRLDNYSYLVHENHYEKDYSYQEVEKLRYFLRCLKKVPDNSEIIKLKEDAMNLLANKRIAERELKDYFRQIGMTDDEIYDEIAQHQRSQEHIGYPDMHNAEWEENERREREMIE